jgi:hypothetical protein
MKVKQSSSAEDVATKLKEGRGGKEWYRIFKLSWLYPMMP